MKLNLILKFSVWSQNIYSLALLNPCKYGHCSTVRVVVLGCVCEGLRVAGSSHVKLLHYWPDGFHHFTKSSHIAAVQLQKNLLHFLSLHVVITINFT